MEADALAVRSRAKPGHTGPDRTRVIDQSSWQLATRRVVVRWKLLDF
jgi:hypothetical protein